MGISDGGIRLTLRLPEDLRDQLLLSSRENIRSMNSEIITLLEQSLINRKKPHNLKEEQGNYSTQKTISDQFNRLKPEQQQLIAQLIGELI
ncbi:MAG: Arc family DNA-binding protein [gamma proteobacterium symbiont of Taylorina sp.]|nr:Arc family DNA-binding protein [gamma proteobacterium symbiont of Taylorina sp.]